jgi:Family of unknown function (DUF5343)
MVQMERYDSMPGRVPVTPPYVQFAKVKLVIQRLNRNGTPSVVDRNVMPGVSAQAERQIMAALRFLGLLDRTGHPEDALHRLMNAYGTNLWEMELSTVLRTAYLELFRSDLTDMTPARFREMFDRTFRGNPEVKKKSARFFLHAAKDAGIPISSWLLASIKPRGGASGKPTGGKPTGGKPARRSGGVPDLAARAGPAPLAAARKQPPRCLSQMLIGEFDPLRLTDAQQDVVLKCFKLLKKEGL